MEQQQLKKRLTSTKIYDVTEGLGSPRTEETYRGFFDAFLKHEKITKERLLQLDPRELEERIAEYLVSLDEQKGFSHSSINCVKCAIIHFFVINRITLNTRWISKFIKPDENHKEDRAYSEDEIRRLLAVAPDQRYRLIFLLLAAAGMRIGAVPELRVGDITKVKFPSISDAIYVIWVYNRSAKFRYYCFATLELTKALDDYLDYRKRFGEIIRPESPLIRNQFNIDDPVAMKNRSNQLMKVKTFQTALTKLKRKAGLYSSLRGQVHLTNGFRKRCNTMMIQAKVDYNTKEYLLGHKTSRGLDFHYDKTEQDVRFQEWVKAIDLLTINPEYRLRKENEQLRKSQNEYLAELGDLRQDFDEMKQMLAGLTQMDNKKELLDEFYRKAAVKVQQEYWTSDEGKQHMKETRRQLLPCT